MPTGSVIDTRCVQVISTGDITVVVFSRQGSNGDAYLALPMPLLGQLYLSVNYYMRASQSASFIVITAPFNDSKIRIRVPDFRNIVSFMFADRLYGPEETIVVTLSAYQVLQLQINDDLTGTHIVSDKPISVLSGVNRTTVYGKHCKSHVMDSLPPVRRLGYQYITVTEPQYREPTVYRIVATQVATRVEMGTNIIILNKTGDYYESVIEPNNFYFLQSSKPVLVAQLSTSNYNGTYRSGDPSMMILTPLQAARDFYTFSVVDYKSYTVYVTIVINSSDVTGLRLNNQTISTNWTAVTGCIF
ncbi:IgGFc-binding protein-like [Patella vulgata]|uniref:IgGFc-binding protein-like n=1 Tax=Patella vulgata TaxID=6465 RepID=UPI0024A9A447|nr:IgGFc-binding protein-like [Patella vulgata]